MMVCEYPLQSEGSPLYLWYSILGQNPTPTVPVSYSLSVVRGQVRFDVGIRNVVFWCCW
jgi:hypothetical protein